MILTVTQAGEELYKGPPSLYVVPYDNGEFIYTITSTYDGEVFNGSETSVFKVLHV